MNDAIIDMENDIVQDIVFKTLSSTFFLIQAHK